MTPTIWLYIICFGLGIAVGVFIMALLAAKSDKDDYYTGYHDGKVDSRIEMQDAFDNVCSHCAYRGH